MYGAEIKHIMNAKRTETMLRLLKKAALAVNLISALLCPTVGAAEAEAGQRAVDPAAITAAHNQWRSQVGVPALIWSDNLAANARNWADQLAEEGCKMKHSTSTDGENIYWASPLYISDGTTSVQEVTDRNVVDAWGNEVTRYDYAMNSCHGVCGHYTQVVWKSTKEVGCGMTHCNDKGQIWVCRYHPSGNSVGRRPY